MQARPGVIDYLNRHLTIELTAINTYFLQSEMCKNWGYPRLAEKLRDLSMGEMRDTQDLIAHILFLEGLPNLQRLNTVIVGEDPHECLKADLESELETVALLTEAVAHCQSVGDYATRGILEDMLRDEESHVDWFETQLETIRQIGIEHYLAQHMRD